MSSDMVVIEDLHKKFGELEVLKGVNTTIRKGEVVVILGPSGSGKSTILRCINRLEEPTSGHIYIDGVEMTGARADLNRMRQKVGMVFQQFNLFPHMTALQNVTLAPTKVQRKPKQEAEKIGLELLKKVGLSEKANSYPMQLSGGQQQRVAIARALVNEPAVILADEPTGNLDTTTTHEIMQLFTDLNQQGITIVMITHEPEVAEYASRRITFRDGSIISDTAHQD